MTEEQALSIFQYQQQEVRTIQQDGEIYFVADDACKVLGLENVSRAVSRIREKYRAVLTISEELVNNTVTSSNSIISEDLTNSKDGPGNPNKICLKEPGLYQLIFQSRKPEAEAFQDWVYQEVLPSIRKTGKYNPMGQLDMLEEVQRLDGLLHELAKKQKRFLHDDGDLETTAVAIHRLTQSISDMKTAIAKFTKTLSRTEYAQREDVAAMERALKDAVYHVQRLEKSTELGIELQDRSLDIYGFAGSALEALGQLPAGEAKKQLKQAKDEEW